VAEEINVARRECCRFGWHAETVDELPAPPGYGRVEQVTARGVGRKRLNGE